MLRSPKILLLLPMLLASLSAMAGSAVDQIEIVDPYARAVPPGQPNSASFMSLTNKGEQATALVAAESDVAKAAELHNHIMDGEVMRMRRVDQIDLPAGETVTLEPGGLHIMLIGLARQLAPEEQIELTLIFADDSRKTIEIPVRKIQVDGHSHHHH